MRRREFLQTSSGGVAASAAALAFPAIAQSQPAIKWRLASSFPKSLDTLFGAADQLAKRVFDLTDGKFEIRAFAAGEIVPAFGVLDAVQQNTVECAHTASYYQHGKNKAFSLDCTVPFGLSARQMNGWFYFGDGLGMMREFFAQFNVVNFPGGNTGTQMGGWFRKEIKTLDDLKGLKMRIPGFGAEVFSALGAVPQAIPGGEIYPALERGAIDAAEWVGPYDDEKLGFYKVAKFYYYPGWWESGTMGSFYVNKEQWEKLPKSYQAAFEAAAAEANTLMLAAYDAKNPPALARLLQNGVQVSRYPDDVLRAAYEASQKIYEEESAKNPVFKKILDSQRAFQRASDVWLGTAEGTLANFMQKALRGFK